MLKKTQWSKEFEQHMRNRLVLGSIRYGKLNAKGKRKYNRIDYAIKALQKYRKEKNKEDLVDAANLCLLEFEEGDGIFVSVDDKDHVK